MNLDARCNAEWHPVLHFHLTTPKHPAPNIEPKRVQNPAFALA
jgi:hypothetical protein